MAKQIKAEVVIGAKADGSLSSTLSQISKETGKFSRDVGKIGAAVTAGVTTPAVAFAKSAGTLYADFEDNMLVVKALGELTTREYKEVSEAARIAGATTRYTASQAAEALVLGARSGLNVQDNMALLNTTMIAAQAGIGDLALSSEQLNTAMAVLGFGVDGAEAYVDKLAKTAARSKTDMVGLGEGITKLGGLARQFAGGEAEVLALLGVAGNYGNYGSEAGTHLRNTMLSIIAPTSKAADALATFGLSEEEYEEALEGINGEEAAAAMAQMGVNAYDTSGKVRPLMDILGDMDKSMQGMDESAKMDILSKIFPKRTLGFALNLLEAIGGEYEGLLAEIEDSQGFGASIAQIQESGLGGAIREAKSAWEELQLAFAEPLAPIAQEAIGTLRDGLLVLANLTPEQKQAITETVAGVAAAGPALLALSGGAKLISLATAHPILATSVAVVGLITLLDKLSDVEAGKEIRERFGDLEIDAEAFREAIEGQYNATNAGLNAALGNLNGYEARISELSGAFSTARNDLASGIFDAYLMNAELSESDKQALIGMADTMMDTVYKQITERGRSDDAFVNYFFEDSDEASAAKRLLGSGSERLMEEWAQVGNELSSALNSALADGIIDADEQQIIAELIARAERIEQEVARRQTQREIDLLNYKASSGNLSFEGLGTILDEADTFYGGKIEEIENLFGAQIEAARRNAIENDGVIDAKEQAVIDSLYREKDEETGSLSAQQSETTSRALASAFGNAYGQDIEDKDIYNRALQILGDDTRWKDYATGGSRSPLDTIASMISPNMKEWKKYGEIITTDTERMLVDAMRYYTESGMDVPEELTESLRMAAIVNGANGRESVMSREELVKLFGGASEAGELGGEEASNGYAGNLNLQGTTIAEVDSASAIATSGMGEAGDESAKELNDAFEGRLDMDGIIVDASSAALAESFAGGYANGTAYGHGYNSGASDTISVGSGGKADPGGGGGGNKTNEMTKYAQGGFASEPSIFGDVGLEAAIPVKDTPRTRGLLLETMSRAGIDPQELIAADRSVNVTYSPQISVRGGTDGGKLEEILAQEREKFNEQLIAIMEKFGMDTARLQY